MKPYPFCSLNHFTVPVAIACPFTAGGRRAAPCLGRGLRVDHLEGESERAPGRARRRGPVVWPKVDGATLKACTRLLNGSGPRGSKDKKRPPTGVSGPSLGRKRPRRAARATQARCHAPMRSPLVAPVPVLNAGRSSG